MIQRDLLGPEVNLAGHRHTNTSSATIFQPIPASHMLTFTWYHSTTITPDTIFISATLYLRTISLRRAAASRIDGFDWMNTLD